MRDPKRIPRVLERLAKVWERNPDLRLGQLILAADENGDLFYQEDSRLLARLERMFGPPCDVCGERHGPTLKHVMR